VEHQLDIQPTPGATASHDDYFGNATTFFVMQSAHKHLAVRARSVVEVGAATQLASPLSWEQAADRSTMPLDAIECTVDSAPSRLRASLESYARPSFAPERPVLDAVADLTSRIHADFTYAPGTTTIATALTKVFESRQGVCQDFARFEIACLRTIGLPARYVSGYLETVPPAGVPRLLGADASHAWVAVHVPTIGWVDVDPTNNVFPNDTHVTLAWGRDFDDVSPLHGVILGGGEHVLLVSVDVNRLPDSAR
jgi:transglutaminase-like putative cysteine protease